MPDMPLTQTQADFIERFLGVTLPGAVQSTDNAEQADTGEVPGGLSIVKLGKARLEWQSHKKRMLGEINRLKGAVRQAYTTAPEHQALVAASLGKLDTALAQFSDELAEQLDAILNESDPQRQAGLSGQAAKTAAGFLAFCDGDPVISAIDGNEFVPDMNIVGPARARLQTITAALEQ